ncbi:MAG: hypothetical protein ACW964_01460 [Candidatus Hodarchaeales archaeon]|jgi:hypothetical protein
MAEIEFLGMKIKNRITKYTFSTRFTCIDLSGQNLYEISLDPLKNTHSHFYTILLDNNELTDIDLFPLAKCLSLRKFNITANKIKNYELFHK